MAPNTENDELPSDDSMVTCPICLHEIGPAQVVRAPCNHEFCLPCIDRLLLSPTPALQQVDSDGGSIATPTLGSCPMCRQELYLFDLQYKQSGALVHHHENTLPTELACHAAFVESTPQFPGVIGRGSYHFPPPETGAPYYDTSKIPSGISSSGRDRVIEFTNYHWHDPSRTFAGILPLPESKVFQHYHVVLSFSPDWRFVRQGVVRKRRRKYESLSDVQLAYPFDGKWKVVESTWEEQFPVNRQFTVDGFSLKETMMTFPCFIRPRNKDDESSRPKLIALSTMKEFEPVIDENGGDTSPLDLDQHVTPVGNHVLWIDTKDNSIQMRWQRESIIAQVPPDQSQSVGGNSGRLLLRSTENDEDTFLQQQQRSEPQYNKTGIWGNVFCQAMKIGLASYHFGATEEDGAYISYENPATGMWPPLDNGQAIPSRVPFRHISFDAESRTFRGHICWMDDFGTSWSGMARWEYEMIFDSQYTCITGGQVMSFHVHNANDDEGQELSRYGEALTYCNAKLYDVFQNEAATRRREQNHHNDMEDESDFYRETSTQLRRNLQSEGASVRTIALVHRILTAAQDPQGDNPIDYNL